MVDGFVGDSWGGERLIAVTEDGGFVDLREDALGTAGLALESQGVDALLSLSNARYLLYLAAIWYIHCLDHNLVAFGMLKAASSNIPIAGSCLLSSFVGSRPPCSSRKFRSQAFSSDLSWARPLITRDRRRVRRGFDLLGANDTKNKIHSTHVAEYMVQEISVDTDCNSKIYWPPGVNLRPSRKIVFLLITD